MTLHFAEGGAGAAGLFNLGSGEANTWVTLAEAIFAALGKEPKIEFIEMPAAIRDKYQYFTEARMDRLRAAGYERPFTSLEAGVALYVKHHLATDNPYR